MSSKNVLFWGIPTSEMKGVIIAGEGDKPQLCKVLPKRGYIFRVVSRYEGLLSRGNMTSYVKVSEHRLGDTINVSPLTQAPLSVQLMDKWETEDVK